MTWILVLAVLVTGLIGYFVWKFIPDNWLVFHDDATDPLAALLDDPSGKKGTKKTPKKEKVKQKEFTLSTRTLLPKSGQEEFDGKAVVLLPSKGNIQLNIITQANNAGYEFPIPRKGLAGVIRGGCVSGEGYSLYKEGDKVILKAAQSNKNPALTCSMKAEDVEAMNTRIHARFNDKSADKRLIDTLERNTP